MNDFELFISKIKDKGEAISIHRAVLRSERLYNEKHFNDVGPNYLLLYSNNYNAVIYYLKEEKLITHAGDMLNDDATIQHFRADPEYAEAYMHTVIDEGCDEEISIVSQWYKFAHALGPIKRRMLRKA